MAKLSDEEILAILERERNQSRDYASGQLGIERRMAYEYYYGKLFGNEEDGQSQVVSQLVAEVIDTAMPDLLKIFAGSDDAVKCEPRGEHDKDAAEQATDVCNYVFWTQNNGFLLLYEGIKDALLQKTGIWKYYWEEKVEPKVEFYDGLTMGQVTMVHSDPEVEIIGADSYPDPSFPGTPLQPPVGAAQQPAANGPPGAMPGPPMGAMPPGPPPGPPPGMPPPPPEPPMLFNLKVRRKVKRGKVKIDCVPPEEVYVSTRARTIDPQNIPYIGIRTRKTLSALIDMGYDAKIVMDLRSDSTLDDSTGERVARQFRTGSVTYDTEDVNTPSENPTMREVWYNEEYAQIDADGDGIAELISCCSVGDVLLHNEEIERVPLAVITPKIMPHEFFGISLADDTLDLQLLKSTLWRQMLDNLYQVNHPMQYVIEGQVETDDLLSPRPGGIVRGRVPGGVTPLSIPFVAGQSFQMIEFLEQETESRSGISRYGNSPSLNPDSLNKTLGGAEIAVEKSNARLQLIARTFAETGIKQLFQGILWLLGKHQDKPMTIRLRDKWVDVDPRAWNTEYDFSVNVGLGSGSKDQQVQHMMAYGQVLQTVAQQGLVGRKNTYNFANDFGKLLGFKEAGRYVIDPDAPPDPQNQPPQPPPPPQIQVAQINAQADQAKTQAQMQADAQAKQQDLQIEQQKLAMEDAAKQREQQAAYQLQASNDARDQQAQQLQHERELQKMMLDDKFKRDQMALKFEFDAQQKERDRQTQVSLAQHASQSAVDMETRKQQPQADRHGQLMQILQKPKKVTRNPDGSFIVSH